MGISEVGINIFCIWRGYKLMGIKKENLVVLNKNGPQKWELYYYCSRYFLVGGSVFLGQGFEFADAQAIPSVTLFAACWFNIEFSDTFPEPCLPACHNVSQHDKTGLTSEL